jgi:hypothetical protein
MNAVIRETPQQAAQRLALAVVRGPFTAEGLHEWQHADGTPAFWRWRVRKADGKKEMRAMCWNGVAYVPEEPRAPAAGKPLYRLPELLASDSAQAVWIVEGEKCVEALHELGMLATTSGGSSSASGADWTPLRGRRCMLWGDHDAPGERYMVEVAAKLHAIGCTVERIDVAALGLPEKGDVVDWLALHPNATAADVVALPAVKAEQAPAVEACAPEPLRRPLPPPLEYPIDALGLVLGNAAKRIHAVVQAPAGLCGQSVLAAASLAVQAHADVSLSGSVEPLSLWHVTIAESGERKSAADSWALKAHDEHEKARLAEWRSAKAEHDIELAAHNAAARKAEKGKDAAAIRSALDALGAPPDAPLQPHLLVSEPTMEGLHKAYQAGQPSIGLFNADAGDFLGGHAMNKDNRTKSAASFSKLWDSGRFDRVRASDGAGKYYGRRLALHLMVQPIIAEGLLSDDVLTGQGFLARCLLSWPQSAIGTRMYQDIDLSRDADLLHYYQRMRDLLAAAPIMAPGTRNELQPRVLALAPEAMAYWIEVKNAIERAMLGEYACIHAWASKGGSQVARIAGVLTLVDDPNAGVIQREAIERAAALTMYHLDEAARIVGTASVPAPVRHAELLRDWCRDTGRTFLYSSDALTKGPNAIRTKDAFEAAIERLEAAGWAERIEGGAVLDGKRRAKVWRMREGEA